MLFPGPYPNLRYSFDSKKSDTSPNLQWTLLGNILYKADPDQTAGAVWSRSIFYVQTFLPKKLEKVKNGSSCSPTDSVLLCIMEKS